MPCVLRGSPRAHPCPMPQVGALPAPPPPPRSVPHSGRGRPGEGEVGGRERMENGGEQLRAHKRAFPSRPGEDRLLSSPLGGFWDFFGGVWGAAKAPTEPSRGSGQPGAGAQPLGWCSAPWQKWQRCCTLLTFPGGFLCVCVPVVPQSRPPSPPPAQFARSDSRQSAFFFLFHLLNRSAAISYANACL